MRKLLAITALAAACGAPAGEDPGPDANPGTPEFPAPPVGQGIQLVSQATIDPGREQVDCRYVVLPDQPIEVARFEHRYTPGAHHMLLYPTSLAPDQVDEGETFDCTGRGELHATGVAYGGSEPEGELPYPDGIAMRLPAGAVMLLESHYLNTTSEPIDAEVRINLWYATEPASVEAGTIFYYDWHILLPPAPGEASATMRCQVPQDLSLVYATSHMHRRGTAFRSQLLREGAEPMPLHDSESWAAPTPEVFWPPLELAAGDTVEFRCEYRNDLDREVIEGPSADGDEMCIFIAGYWPKMPADHELCLADGDAPVLTGTRTCEQTVDCMVEAGAGNWVEGQRCVADTCAGSAEALSSFVVCVDRYDCWGDQACAAFNCSQPWEACVAAGC
jgi:hypothetical protein